MEKRVANVGAGTSGLIVCKYILDKGFDPIVFEAEDTMGRVWARTLDSNTLDKFTGFPWPSNAKETYPSHSQVQAISASLLTSSSIPRAYINHLLNVHEMLAQILLEMYVFFLSISAFCGYELRFRSFLCLLVFEVIRSLSMSVLCHLSFGTKLIVTGKVSARKKITAFSVDVAGIIPTIFSGG
ncbi:hypothetical protein V6N11_003937 [Hibiscus sabdariffa]|uniref:Flavin-containing monooxygenase n=1 Tax=Hibiscus sabdariffa TaxID=183260 RepID=A0ABR2SF70_9ROSI